jgi:hypothetical protein
MNRRRVRFTMTRETLWLMHRWWRLQHGYKLEKRPTDPDQVIEITETIDEEAYQRMRAEQKRRLAEGNPRTTLSEIVVDTVLRAAHMKPAPIATARFLRRKKQS